jgi:hypothetical protein
MAVVMLASRNGSASTRADRSTSLSDPKPDRSSPDGGVAPTITGTADGVTGEGFLPGRRVTICVTYIEDDVSDYLSYTAGPDGRLRARVPTSHAPGALRIRATDHRSDPDGECGLLWSNAHTASPPKH